MTDLTSTYNKIYIRYSTHFADRFKSHNELATKGYTVRYRTWTIDFQEEFNTKAEAL
ncbi:GIY-YIG nuclease family protein [Crocinitomix catalasitica]|uniref:GIY-YIG nuclease family protein n=1 Tax=Crocinitomix catalasitica TaxID=184607 RepID=UPI0012FA34A4